MMRRLRARAILWAALAAASSAAACRSSPPEVVTRDLHGVRLGMGPRDVRARFDAGGEGRWSSAAGASLALEYEGDGSSAASVRRARFEFHGGMLVAVRATLAPSDAASRGAPFEVGPATVVSRAPGEGGAVALFMASRECPDHREEVASIVAAAHGIER